MKNKNSVSKKITTPATMSKIFAILMCITLIATGCGNKDAKPSDANDTTTTTSQTTNTTESAPSSTTTTSAGDTTTAKADDTTTSASDTTTVAPSVSQATTTGATNESTTTSKNTSATTSATSTTTTTANSDPGVVEKITEVFDFTCEFPDSEVIATTYNDPKNGNKLPYRLFMPANYDPAKEYPVLLVLHGAGEMGKNNTLQLHNVKKIFECNGDIISQGFVLCPQTDVWWDLGGSNLTGKLGSVLHLLEEVQDTYSCDANRIYVTGLSMGGYATWDLLAQHGNIFAAGMPVCGGSSRIGQAAAMKDIPIRIYHSQDDDTVPFYHSEMMYDAVVEAGNKNVEFIILDGYVHNAWDYAYADRDGFSWLYAQNKTSNPTCAYEYVPYFTVRDAKGNVIISEVDVRMMYYIGGYNEKEEYVITMNLLLNDNGLSKLTKAYTSGSNNAFTVYWANEKLYTYTANKAPTGSMFSMVGIFDDETATRFYDTVNFYIENRD